MIGPAPAADGRLKRASSGHPSWTAQGLIVFGLMAVMLAPAILVIEIWEWARQGEWPGWSVEDGLGLFGIERGERSETAHQRLADVLIALPLTIALFVTGSLAILSGWGWRRHRRNVPALPASDRIRSIRATGARINNSRRRALRRFRWIQHAPPLGALANAARNGLAFGLGKETAGTLPSMIKIDISPQCQLACPHCLHADPAGRNRPLLEAQRFPKTSKMSFEDYKRIIDELAGKVLAVSLFYYGDPLIHPQLDRMIEYARKSRIAVHITTHFSYKFTPDRIRRLVDSGLSHITVAVDGASQEAYGVTRVRGRLEWVLENLRMLTEYKREQQLSAPLVEVQYLRFPHHAADEKQRVREIAYELGADIFKASNGLRFDDTGDLYNVVDDDPSDRRAPLPNQALPRCHWPYSSMVIKADGDVLPCCLWRVGTQYVPGAETGAVGNVFQRSLASIWNDPIYRNVRRQVSKPASYDEGCQSFCDGCPRLYRDE